MTEQHQLDLQQSNRPPWIEQLRKDVNAWADKGVYFGGSSWKYEGWIGQIYSRDRYLTRNKLSRKKFETTCLKEYAEHYPFVSGDFSFYSFYSEKYWAELFAQVPKTFQFGLKVPEEITAPSFPNHARYGQHAGVVNDHFLNAEMFKTLFVDRLLQYRQQIGYLVFE